MKILQAYFNFILFGCLIFSTSCFGEGDIAARGWSTSRKASINTLYPPTVAKSLQNTLPADKEFKWQIYMPNSEQPASCIECGVLVYISPSKSGKPPIEWLPVLDKYKLIWIGANGFGNKRPTGERILSALMSIKLLKKEFGISNNHRTYVSGFSGGGRVAGVIFDAFSGKFDGAIYFSGVDFWGTKDSKTIDSIIKKRFVFITGRNDFSRKDVKRVFNKYKKAGAEKILLMDEPFHGHELPKPEDFEKAIEFITSKGEEP